MAKEKLKVFAFNEKPNHYHKCVECNNEADVLYVIARNKEEAKKLLKEGKDGVCGECLSSRLVEMTTLDKYNITKD
jgi:hypothetical protein